ncbi:5'-nucleotidase C-terminal domain-containing protein, partial [bacterium]|nr:5'-nucleotidase C-terminal domain-containing protein [bacterium]
QTKGYGAYLGRLDLVINRRNKKIIKHKGEIITLWTEKYPPDKEMASLVEKYASQARGEMDRVIGEALEAIMHDPEGLRESALGNWQTDLMREFAETEIALQNSFGIRGDIPKGEITRRDVYLISPFGNTLVTMELSGEEIWQMLEGSVSEAGVLQVSGLKVNYDSEKPKGERILKIEIEGKPLEPKKTYSLVTNSFLAENVEPFKKGRNVKDTRMKLRDLEEEYIKSNSPIKSTGIQGRIVRHELARTVR